MAFKFLYRMHQPKLKILFFILLVVVFNNSVRAGQVKEIFVTSEKNNVTISWSVQAIQQNVYYEIERAGQDKVFKPAGILFPKENNSGNNEFSFKEKIKKAQTGKIIYYRVKQVNANGTVEYSLIKSVVVINKNITNNMILI